MKFKFQKLKFLEEMYFKFVGEIFMVLKFIELEYHGKLDFAKLEYPKSGKSLHISETVVNYNIVCKKVLFSYFRLLLNNNNNNNNYGQGCPLFWDRLGLGSTCIQSDLIRWSIFQPFDDQRG